MYNDYWKKYQHENNLNCFFKIIDSRKFKSNRWYTDQLPIFFNFIKRNKIENGVDLRNKLFINPINLNETKSIIDEFGKFTLSYCTILLDIIYSGCHYK